ncbi:MAG: SelL-related redox protein [Bryobacteraceae bacterium]
MTATDDRQPRWDPAELATVLDRTLTERGERFIGIVETTPVLLVFLRHAGCTFCREAVSDIAKVRKEIELSGTRIVLVHMGDRSGIEQLLARHGMSDVDRICDPARELYGAFGLKKGSLRALLGAKVWIRGLIAGIVRGHGLSRPAADATQMPGVFLVDHGVIARSYRHRSAADRPCYSSICKEGR